MNKYLQNHITMICCGYFFWFGVVNADGFMRLEILNSWVDEALY